MENKQILNTYKQINFIYYEFFKHYYSNNVVYNEYRKILNNFYKTKTFKKFMILNKTDLKTIKFFLLPNKYNESLEHLPNKFYNTFILNL